MSAYYNENDPVCVEVLRELMRRNVIVPGEVDGRSIKEVTANDLRGFTQCHFFAGAGLWSVAARLAGWPDDRALWTGSCPCQPFSQAGKGLGEADPRHLWPDFHRLIDACRPAVVMGEQVAGKAGRDWFHGVRSDLAGSGYEGRAVDIPACSVDAPHIRNRLYWIARSQGMADTDGCGRDGRQEASQRGAERGTAAERAAGVTLGYAVEPRSQRYSRHGGSAAGRALARGSVAAANGGGQLVNAAGIGRGEGRSEHEIRRGRDAAANANGADMADAHSDGRSARERHDQAPRHGHSAGSTDGRNGTFWSGADWIVCHDGKARRAESSIRLLADGMAGRIDLWRIAGNSIVPQLAAEVIAAYLEAEG